MSLFNTIMLVELSNLWPKLINIFTIYCFYNQCNYIYKYTGKVDWYIYINKTIW